MTGKFDILNIFTYELVDFFEGRGYETLLINVDNFSDDISRFVDFYKKGNVKAVFTFNTLGMFIKASDGQNFWNRFGVTIVNILMDHPYVFAESLPDVPSGCIMISPDQKHVEYMMRFYPNISNAAFLGHGGIQKHKKPKTIKERSIDVMYAGSISRPFVDNIMPDFSKYDFNAKNLGDEAYDILVRTPSKTVEDVLEEVLLVHDIHFTDEELREFIADMHYIDILVVSHFREMAVRSLCENGIKVTLFGYGWDSLDWINNEYMDYRGRVSAFDIIDYMADSKIVLSTQTWFKHGTHDRVFNGMLQGACVVTDTSEYMTRAFDGMYAGESMTLNDVADKDVGFFRLEDMGALPGFVAGLLADDEKIQLIADNGREKSIRFHTWERRGAELDEDLIRFL